MRKPKIHYARDMDRQEFGPTACGLPYTYPKHEDSREVTCITCKHVLMSKGFVTSDEKEKRK